jgi:16S rRNA pseudouridine516 synthase
MSTLRLDRLLASALGLSRRDATTLVRDGTPTLARDPSAHVNPAIHKVLVDGSPLAPPGPTTLLLHKPAGCVTATRDDHLPTVLDLVPAALRTRDLAPAGRLDRDTTGLLILTDDGALNHRLTHPARHLPKRYIATLAAPLPVEAAARVAAGLVLGDGTALKPAELQLLAPADDGLPRIALTLHEGRYHQVKRMVAALGSSVVALHRASIGGLMLPPDLLPGACRRITDDEIAALLDAPHAPA